MMLQTMGASYRRAMASMHNRTFNILPAPSKAARCQYINDLAAALNERQEMNRKSRAWSFYVVVDWLERYS
jgi:hypothetical protein